VKIAGCRATVRVKLEPDTCLNELTSYFRRKSKVGRLPRTASDNPHHFIPPA